MKTLNRLTTSQGLCTSHRSLLTYLHRPEGAE
jgi:hypothetical protein